MRTVTSPTQPSQPFDLAAAAFATLASTFFDEDGVPVPFALRDKLNTQDDPFDEFVGQVLDRQLPDEIKVITSGKPLVSPDLVVARPEESRLLIRGGTDLDSRRIAAIEVKKVNADVSGRAARGSGIDYNSTPPCQTVKVEAADGSLLRIPAFYLFVVLAPLDDQQVVKTLALVSGAVLNRDTDLYDAAVGQRQKRIGLGSYRDGLDRQRPMFVFANPLGWDWLAGTATLIHSDPTLEDEQPMERVREVVRLEFVGHELADESVPHSFWCYRLRNMNHGATEPTATEPFPRPAKRSANTTPRGRFQIKL